ncbi:MAG: B12-binding domain-containing radical SAM protein [bacterium]|nr:B12-binding domain-containing radical SAM protein [bacterium]
MTNDLKKDKKSQRKDTFSKRRVLLVYPEIPPTYWSFRYALPFVGKKAAIPPLGLLTVAAMLPPSYEVKFVDMNVTPLENEMIAQADLVLASAMIVQKESLARLADQCRQLAVPLAAGGPYPTSSYEKIENVDYFILNEAEVTLPPFLADFEQGQARRVYTDQRRADITMTPQPRFDLLSSLHDYGSMALQYSRGCPFNCEFCDIIEMFGRKPRTKTNQQFMSELELLYSLGWRGSVFIVDDNFVGNKQQVKQLLPLIAAWQKQRGYPFDLFTEASVDMAADEELMEMMSAAGFNMVFLGIETPVEETLLSTGKKQNVRQDLLESVCKIQNKGIEVAGGFIVGFDTDPPDIFDRQIKFIQESGIVLAMVGLLTALPGTQLYRRLQAEGRLVQDSTGNNTHDFQLNFVPKMDLSTLLHGYKRLIAQIYHPRSYFNRCLNFLRNINPHQNSSRKIGAEELYALFMSLTKQTFSNYGHHYLKYLVKSFFIKPRMFPEAVRQAIMGYHFFKITREILAVDDFKTRVRLMIEAYREKILDAYSLEFDKAAKELKIIKDNLLKELRKEYLKIDKDFRHLVEESFRTLESALNTYYGQLIEATNG